MARNLFALLILGLFVYVTSPLLLPVAMGGVFAVLFFPWLEWLERRKLPSPLASGSLTLGVTLVFLLPASFLIFIGTKAGFSQVKMWKEAPANAGGSVLQDILGHEMTNRFLTVITSWLPVSAVELTTAAQDFARAVGVKLAEILGTLVSQLPGMAMGFVIMVLSIYFFLLDGRKIVNFVRRNSFFGAESTTRLINAFGGLCQSVILASVISGCVQSFFYGLACLLAGVSNLALVVFAVLITSFVPLIGSMPVTFGVALYQLLIGHKAAGITLLIMAAVVSVLDNFIRPLVLKGGANLHPLIAFVAVFGGMQVLGVAGIFIGPIVAGLFVAMLENLIQDAKNIRS